MTYVAHGLEMLNNFLMNFPAASHGVTMDDTFYPNPDKPELKIEDCRLKIYGIARAAQALAPRVALSFLSKSIALQQAAGN
jgi:hypothetical protein